MPQIGRQITVGYAKDSIRNTAQSAATSFFSWKEFEVDVKNEYFEDNSAFGIRESIVAKEITQQSVEGKLTDFIDPSGSALGQMLFHTFGQVTTNQWGSTGAYQHVFGRFLNNVQVPTFTLQYQKSDIGNIRARGCAIKTLELDFTDKECTLKVDFIGIAEETGQSQTVVLTKPTQSLLGKNILTKIASTIGGLSGVGSITITAGGTGYTSPTVTIGTAWAATTAVALGQQLSSGGNLYTVTVAGTTGASAPVHTSGAVANGSATLAFAGTAATATATASGGAVNTVTVTNAGSGYLTAPAITFGGGSGGAGSSQLGTDIKIRKLNVKIDTGVDYDPAFGSVNPNDTRAGAVKVEASIDAVVRNTTFYNLHLNNTKQAFEFDANANNYATLGTSGSAGSFASLFPRLRIRIPPSSVEVTHKFDIDDQVMFTAKIVPEFSVTDNYMVEILLQNTTASY